MFFLKVLYYLNASIKKICYKLLYGKRVKFGKKVTFRKGFSLMIDKNAFLIIGDNCFFNNYCSINVMGNVTIGNNCIFGENVKIYDHNHIFKDKETLIKEQGFKIDKIKIEDDCWFGSNVVVLKGVNVGKHTVVGCGTILKKDVDQYTVVNEKGENLIK